MIDFYRLGTPGYYMLHARNLSGDNAAKLKKTATFPATCNVLHAQFHP